MVGQAGWELRQIRVVWTSPRQRNGVILQYQLNVTEAEAPEPLQSHVIKTKQEDTAGKSVYVRFSCDVNLE